MHRSFIALMSILVGFGLLNLASAADRVVVAEEIYQET